MERRDEMLSLRDDEIEMLSLRDYLTVVRQQRHLIALVTLGVMLLGLASFLIRTPEYEALSELQLERVRTAQDISLSELLNPNGVIGEAEIAAASSIDVADLAADLLDRDDPDVLLSRVTVDTIEGTQRLRFRATHPEPQQAARIADAFAKAFVEYRRAEAIASVTAVQEELTARADELRTEIAAVDAELADLQPAAPAADATDESATSDEATTDQATEPAQIPSPASGVESLQIRRSALQSQLSQVILRSTELGSSAEALTGFSAGFTPAAVPSEPIGPDWIGALGLSFTLGLMLAIGLAFVRDHFDDVVRTETDLKRATGSLPVLGRIPLWKPGSGDAERRLVSMVDPSSHAAEAYRELSAGVRFLLVARADEIEAGADNHHGLGRSRSVLVSSATMGEGKTATAANLAVATARVGLRTILVDADLRRSAVARHFGLPQMRGLSDVLLNADAAEDYLVDVGVPQLRILPAGTVPPNPTELLASPAMRALHKRLLATRDLVIYDTPAILAVADTLEIGPFVDLGIIVGRVGATTRRRLQSALERLQQVGTDVSGTVLNGLQQQSEGYYYEPYLYEQDEYQHDEPAPGPPPQPVTSRPRQRDAPLFGDDRR